MEIPIILPTNFPVPIGDDMTAQFTILSKEEVFPMQDSCPHENLSQKWQELEQNEYTKCFDYDKIKRYMTARCRQTGDYLTISDGKGKMLHKSLKDYMISQKNCLLKSKKQAVLICL